MRGELEKYRKETRHEEAMTANVNKEPDYDADLEKRAREAGL